MEDFFQQFQLAIGRPPLRVFEKTSHLGLPAIVNLSYSHASESLIEVRCFEVSNEQPVFPQEQRVVAPTGLTQGLEHLRPHYLVPRLVLLHPFGLYSKLEADTLVMSHVESVPGLILRTSVDVFQSETLIYTLDFTPLLGLEWGQRLYILLIAFGTYGQRRLGQTIAPMLLRRISMPRFLNAALLAAALMTPIAIVPTALLADDRTYHDKQHNDDHHWDSHEDRAYRMWAKENHRKYREFSRIPENDQQAYWGWRHEHSDAVLKINIR
jgi:hypothetical protein